MALTGKRTFVGFGFGAIQAGLFLHEAFQSGGFRRLVVAEVLPELVNAVREARGAISVNVAHFDRVEISRIAPVELTDPDCALDRTLTIDAVAEAEEIATAVPSVRHYVSDRPGSIHRLLAEGLRKKARNGGPAAIVYAAENHNHAAEILESKVMGEIPAIERQPAGLQVQFLNTVIGKMSGVVSDPAEIRQRCLTAITPSVNRAFLVEAFNRILITRIHFAFRRGIEVFEEKDNLLPFEEAKLYGHNATHALAAYLGAILRVQRIADLRTLPEVIRFLRAAFLEESGEALIRKYNGLDALFTADGYRSFAEDLIERMLNPFLQDTVERVGRDAQRKLGWDDRLIGTMRLALREGVNPRRYALGVAAALEWLNCGDQPAAAHLDPLWRNSSPDPLERAAILNLVESARHRLRRWRESGVSDPETA